MAEVGKREVRVDAFDKATGRTKYYEDLMPGTRCMCASGTPPLPTAS